MHPRQSTKSNERNKGHDSRSWIDALLSAQIRWTFREQAARDEDEGLLESRRIQPADAGRPLINLSRRLGNIPYQSDSEGYRHAPGRRIHVPRPTAAEAPIPIDGYEHTYSPAQRRLRLGPPRRWLSLDGRAIPQGRLSWGHTRPYSLGTSTSLLLGTFSAPYWGHPRPPSHKGTISASPSVLTHTGTQKQKGGCARRVLIRSPLSLQSNETSAIRVHSTSERSSLPTTAAGTVLRKPSVCSAALVSQAADRAAFPSPQPQRHCGPPSFSGT